MSLSTLNKFRKLITLRDGTRILFRILEPGDKDALIELFRTASDADLEQIRSDVRDEGMVARWAEDVDMDHVMPMVAIVQDRIVGEATLHFRKKPHMHVAEVRIFLAKDFRRRGLGMQMLSTMFELARWKDIYLLEAQIVADQTRVIKAFKKLGFEQQGLMDDYFMTPQRELRDVMVLVKRLKAPLDEF